MALLSSETTKKVTATVALEESIAKQVNQYSAMLEIPADDVVNKALMYVFKACKDFQKFRENHADAKAHTALRVKVPVTVSEGAKRGRKPMLALAK